MFTGVVTAEDAANISFSSSISTACAEPKKLFSCYQHDATQKHQHFEAPFLIVQNKSPVPLRESGLQAGTIRTQTESKISEIDSENYLQSPIMHGMMEPSIKFVLKTLNSLFRRRWITRRFIISPLNLGRSWRHVTCSVKWLHGIAWHHDLETPSRDMTSHDVRPRDVNVPAASNGEIEVTVSSLDVTWR